MSFMGGYLIGCEEIEGQKNTFQTMDKNKDGTLDLEELKEGMKEHMSAFYFE